MKQTIDYTGLIWYKYYSTDCQEIDDKHIKLERKQLVLYNIPMQNHKWYTSL